MNIPEKKTIASILTNTSSSLCLETNSSGSQGRACRGGRGIDIACGNGKLSDRKMTDHAVGYPIIYTASLFRKNKETRCYATFRPYRTRRIQGLNPAEAARRTTKTAPADRSD